jgi:hypothetical protein
MAKTGSWKRSPASDIRHSGFSQEFEAEADSDPHAGTRRGNHWESIGGLNFSNLLDERVFFAQKSPRPAIQYRAAAC